MTLLSLPDELLAPIVDHAIPEGFESLCLSCRKLHLLCKPLIKQHNVLRAHFRNFDFYIKDKHPTLTIRTSYELIARIAEEPIVARYIEHADFKQDLRRPIGLRLWFMEDNGYRPEIVRDLFARSRYLEGEEWQDYFAQYERELEDNQYCQATAAFLLTLLPNVKSVVLPRWWTFDEGTEKLVEGVVEHARKANAIETSASLALLTTLKTGYSLASRQGFVLDKITPLLALPRIHEFHGTTSVFHTEAHSPSSPHQPLPPSIVGGTLQIAHLLGSNLSSAAMASFLRNTRSLKTLLYSHSDKQLCTPIWDICTLVTTIGNEVGSHLEELSITKHDFTGKVALGTADMRGFTRLHKLEFPLDLATCVIRSDLAAHCGPEESREMDAGEVAEADASYGDRLMCGLVPSSVTRLFLRSDEWEKTSSSHDSPPPLETINGTQVFAPKPQQHELTLATMFRGFASKQAAQLPVLREIRVGYHWTAGEAYKARCRGLRAEAEKVDVIVNTDATRWSQILGFAGGAELEWAVGEKADLA